MVRTPFIDGDFDFWPMYDRGDWEPETKQILERFLHPGDLFVDIGAWIGPVSLWARDLGADVIAYEPDPVAYVQLVTNCPDILAINQAVAAHDGHRFLTNPRFYGDSQTRFGDDGLPALAISPRTLWDSLPRTPALIKLDVEGAETEILPTLAPLCQRHHVPLYLSWHTPWWQHVPTELERAGWFEGMMCEPVRGDGWNGFTEMLAR